MTSFSERIGATKPKSGIQLDGMDARLRNRLWNVAFSNVIKWGTQHSLENAFCVNVYDQVYGLPITNLPLRRGDFVRDLQKKFAEFKWYEVYNFIEFCAHQTYRAYSGRTASYYEKKVPAVFQNLCNQIFSDERSGYRFVDGIIAPITDETEIAEIETASKDTNSHHGASTHIRAALSLYANRDAPDFRNSVKESISAVEATAKWLAEDPSASCGTALTKIEQDYGLHGALKSGFSSLYGWTSQDGGARHALMDRETITEADARYMLVSCSAFCNYLVSLKAHGQRAEA